MTNEVLNQYYCRKCTAQKAEGWRYCPFCGCNDHFHYIQGDAKKICGDGAVSLQRAQSQSTGDISGLAQQGSQQTAQMEDPCWDARTMSSEEMQFNDAVKVIRNASDNLKRARRRDKNLSSQIIELEGTRVNLLNQVHSLEKEVTREKQRNREPLPILQVIGKKSDLDYPLGILSVDGNPSGVVVRVALP